MDVVFFGSSKFVIPIIEAIRKSFSAKGGTSNVPATFDSGGPASGWDIALVVTTEKNPTDPIPAYCIKSKVCYYVVTDFRNKRVIGKLRKVNPEIGILASFGAIIPNEVLNLFPHGIINIHPSLLPKYRGPTPVQTAILNGDKKTGVSIIKLDEEVDHGPILTQKKELIKENDTNESLYERLFKLSASSIVSTIELYLKGKIKPQEQDHSKATFTKRLTREDGHIDLQSPPKPEILDRMIRAYYPWPSVWTRLRPAERDFGEQAKLKIIKFLPNQKIQVEGKKPMSYKDFLNGYPKIGKEILAELNLLDNNK